MVPGFVIDQNIGAGLHVARKDVPRGDDQIIARRQTADMGHAAGGDDCDVRPFRSYCICVRQTVEMKGNASPFAFRHAPVDDRHHLPPPLGLRGQPYLPARLIRRLMHNDFMPPRGGDPRRLQPSWPGANDNHAARRLSPRNVVRLRQFPPGRRVVDAKRGAALIDAVEAVIRPDAGADAVLLS